MEFQKLFSALGIYFPKMSDKQDLHHHCNIRLIVNGLGGKNCAWTSVKLFDSQEERNKRSVNVVKKFVTSLLSMAKVIGPDFLPVGRCPL